MNVSDQLSTWWGESRQGNVESFGFIHHKLYPALYRYVFGIVMDDDICQDILQDLFIRMWERKESLGPIYNVKVYFFKAARSMTFNYLKSNKNHATLTELHDEIDAAFSQEEILIDQENKREMNSILSAALNDLPKRQKEMIMMKFFDDRNYDEIAEETGIKYQSVVNHVHRAINQLRCELADGRCLQTCRVAV